MWSMSHERMMPTLAAKRSAVFSEPASPDPWLTIAVIAAWTPTIAASSGGIHSHFATTRASSRSPVSGSRPLHTTMSPTTR